MIFIVIGLVHLQSTSTQAFAPVSSSSRTTRYLTPTTPTQNSALIAVDSSAEGKQRSSGLFLFGSLDPANGELKQKRRFSLLSTLWKRLDTLDSSGLKDEALTSGFGQKLKSLHNPKTYLGISILALMRWNSLGRNPVYWFGFAFFVKWYRARYVFKIPVWDRQPNWNNIITSKEQEKDLKAFTCKKCGSTIFIAKTREFFFEGATGIGGLGCFSCGAKGAENFEMDRERIIEDVADVDDYFEYERPLDFVTRAERRKLLKEAEGDEEKANELLVGRAESSAESPSPPETTAAVEEKPNLEKVSEKIEEENVEPKERPERESKPSASSPTKPKKEVKKPSSEVSEKIEENVEPKEKPERESKPPASSPTKPKKEVKKPSSKGGEEGLDLDALDMDL